MALPDTGRAGAVRMKPTRTLNAHDKEVMCLALDPDGKKLATGSADGAAKVWDLAKGTELHALKGDGGIVCLAFTPDGKHLAGGGDKVTFWEVESGKAAGEIAPEQKEVRSLAFSPSGKWLLTGGVQGPMKVWHTPQILKKQ